MDFYDAFTRAERSLFLDILGGCRPPDLTISPDGNPYLYRWHVVPRNKAANVYLHVQVSDDPRGELHDHPWNNSSVILAGGYEEILDIAPAGDNWRIFERKPGDVIFRRARWAHRLLMAGHPYTMTLFSTGPKIRDWGYWFPDGWHHNKRHNVTVDGVAVFKEEK